ncbi:HNH endonuclease [compost metagenome]
MFLRKERWKNGDGYTLVEFYSCDECGGEICESHPHYAGDNAHYCWNCSFIKSLISDNEFLRWSGYHLSGYKAGVYEGKIHIWTGETPPWELTNQDYRRTAEYRKWRLSVLARDNHRCRHCGSFDNLQAHHIKPFAKYKKLRFVVSNGLTLCETCHKAEHRKNRSG